MTDLIVDQTMLDAADDGLLESVRNFVETRGGITVTVGGIELVIVSKRKFCVLVHCEGFAPPLPGAPVDG